MKNYDSKAIETYYGSDDLVEKIFAAFRKAGLDTDKLTPDDLAKIGELHIRGRQSTIELAHLTGLTEGMEILDVGCGIGIPASALACFFNCKVTGIDVTKEFCNTATLLCEKMGLREKVKIYHANALDMPFEDNSFDVVWLQHVVMNISEKEELFREISRVLRPMGKLAIHEVCKGTVPDMRFPVPWAPDPDFNFPVTVQELQNQLKSAGFVVQEWDDNTQTCIDLGRKFIKKEKEKSLPMLNQGVVIGPEFPIMARNYFLNLDEGRLKVIRAVMSLGS